MGERQSAHRLRGRAGARRRACWTAGCRRRSRRWLSWTRGRCRGGSRGRSPACPWPGSGSALSPVLPAAAPAEPRQLSLISAKASIDLRHLETEHTYPSLTFPCKGINSKTSLSMSSRVRINVSTSALTLGQFTTKNRRPKMSLLPDFAQVGQYCLPGGTWRRERPRRARCRPARRTAASGRLRSCACP